MKRIILCLLLGVGGASFLSAQEIELGDPQMLLVRERQWDIYGVIHTNGFGIGGRFGKIHNIHLESGFDFEYTYYRHFKEKSYLNAQNNNFSVFGKLAYMAQLRAGYGLTRIIASKPYFGGVEVGYFFYGGVSVALLIPVYLEVFDFSADKIVKIRASEDLYENGNISIQRRLSMFEKTKGTMLHPGAYLKTGLSFDFSRNDGLILKLDLGAAADIYPIPIKKMAFSPAQYVLLTGYLSFHIGKKLTIYE
ncbi:MAG: hypothetical protein LBR36_05535 [Bacteroidales bacterium]|jgi:hypothetical protein|nr:hypothetical protein [Bacteroidales bacterium]